MLHKALTIRNPFKEIKEYIVLHCANTILTLTTTKWNVLERRMKGQKLYIFVCNKNVLFK